MKVGDLVYLDREQFHEWDEHIGIVIEVIDAIASGNMIRVVWLDGEQDWYMDCELEVINESR